MQKEEALESLEKKEKIRKFLIVSIISVLIVIIIFLSISAYLYFKTPEKQLSLGANIEEVKVSPEKDVVYIKLAGESDKNITKIKFIFTDKNKEEYYYETSEGIKEIEVPFKRGFWDWLFGREFSGKYDYEINSDEIGLNNFENINEVSVSFEYETGSGTSVITPTLDTTKLVNKTTTGGGSSNGGNGGITCTDTCQSKGYECGMQSVCGASVDCGNCSSGEECQDEKCKTTIPECTPNMQITQNCLCSGIEKSNGYCCSYGWQQGSCATFEASYYVDNLIVNNCTNYNVSTRSCGNGDKKAFNTIQKGVNVLQPGDILAVRDGVYRESVDIKVNGTVTNRITIKSYPGENPILEGTKEITGWTKCYSQAECFENPNWQNVYYAKTNINPKEKLLFEDLEYLQIAQEPDQSDPALEQVSEFISLENEGNNFGHQIVTINPGQADGQVISGNLVNITAEVNFTHLSISTSAPYDSLVGYWNFDGDKENTKLTKAYDWTKYNNDGNYTGDVVTNSTNCIYGDCVNLMGAGNHIDIPRNTIIEPSNITISLWFKVSAVKSGANDNDLITKKRETNYASYRITINSSGGRFVIYNSTKEINSPISGSFALNTWYYLVATYDHSNIRFYVNGIEVGSGTPETSNIVYSTGYGLTIGGGVITTDSNPFNGTIDEVMIFNTSLTSAQILDIYNNQSSRFATQGTQNIVNPSYINITNGNNRVNVTTYIESLLSSSINLSVGFYNTSNSWFYTNPQIVSSGVVQTFNISSTSTNLTLNFTFYAGNSTNPFYSLIIQYNASLVNSGTVGSFSILDPDGFYSTLFKNGETIIVGIKSGSNINNGTYTLTRDATYNSSITTLTVDREVFDAPYNNIEIENQRFFVDTDKLTQDDDYWNGTKIRFWTHDANNVVVTKYAKDFIKEKNMIIFDTPLSWPVSPGGTMPDAYAFQNHPLILDKPGEYYHTTQPDANGNYTLYLWPRNSVDLGEKIGISTLAVGFYINYGKSYLTIDGFTIRGYSGEFSTSGSINTYSGGIIYHNGPDHEGLIIRNNKVYNIRGYGGISIQNGNFDVIDNNLVYNILGGNGILITGTNVKARNNNVYKMAGTGFNIGIKKGIIMNNTIGKGGTHSNAIAVYDGNENVLVMGNKINNNRLTFQMCNNLTIYNNILHNGGGYVVADWGQTGENVYIFNNIVIGDTTNTNAFYARSPTTISKNNIIQGGSTVSRSHNIYIKRAWSQVPASWNLSEGEIVADGTTTYGPNKTVNDIFQDYPSNLRLKQNSIAIDSGTNILAILPEYLNDPFFAEVNFSQDIEGNPRPSGSGWDIGAYEYQEGINPSLSPFTQLLNFLKGLLTTKTGNAILTGKTITGNAINETGKDSKVPYIILSLLAVVILVIVVIIKIKENKKESRKKSGKRIRRR